MTKFGKIYDSVNTIVGDDPSRRALVDIIDEKVEDGFDRIVKHFDRSMDKLQTDLEAKIDTSSAKLNARIDKVESKIDLVNSELNAKIDKVDAKIDLVNSELNAKIDKVSTELNAKIDKVDAKIDLVNTELNAKIVKVDTDFNTKIDKVNSKLSSYMRISNIFVGISTAVLIAMFSVVVGYIIKK